MLLHLILILSLLLITSVSVIESQQPYIKKATTLCSSTDNSTSVLGYTCNGRSSSCQAYLTFRAQSPYNTLLSISTLLSANPTQLAQLNSVPQNAIFETNKMVLVPVQCSCSGQYYQANTSYVIGGQDTYFMIANNTFQGLSTCQALRAQNTNLTRNIFAGTRINVPLRCACPTRNQTDSGIGYLLSYLVTWGQAVSIISAIFGVDTGTTLSANGLSEVDFTIYPFTTLLVPLQNPPSSNQTIASPPPPATSPPPPPATTPSGTSSSNKTWVFVVVGVLGGVALTLLIGFILFYVFFRKNKKKKKKESDQIIASETFDSIEKPSPKKMEGDQEFLESLSFIGQSLNVYTYKELKSATEDFSPSCWIKGSVYRGNINGDYAAIKKMDGDVSKEINLLNRINHHNLIRLSGVCFNDGQWYLVYEYAVNGPLSDWIYENNESSKKFLSWNQRIQIALDVATGLNYLHSYSSPPYVHKDLKMSNILLDSEMRAKITNFDLARSAEGQEGQFTLTRHIVGTKGYMSPEYVENGLVSTKLDVYAFGVLMLELLTGRRVAAFSEGGNKQLSVVLVPLLNEEGGDHNLRNFIDPSLEGNYPAELAIYVVRLIKSCITKDPSSRPDMNEIVHCLSTTLNMSLSGDVSTSIPGYQSHH